MLRWINKLFPGICVFCGLATNDYSDICRHCRRDLPYIKQSCRRCGHPLVTTDNYCGNCINKKLSFERTYALFSYQQPIDRLITGLKFANKLLYSKILGELLLEHLQQRYQQQQLPEVIIPVPLHKQRLRMRGYNQATELARPIAKVLKIPIDDSCCIRKRNTAAQASLTAKQRSANVKNAFSITKTIKYQNIAIIDDVITTGNTVNELSKVLRQAGSTKIAIWCCAKT